MAFDLIDELERVVAALEAAGIDYALCGGLAYGLYAEPRFTRDIDLLLMPDDLSRAVAVVRAIGFDVPARKMIFGLRAGTPREVQRISRIDVPTGELMTVDFLIVANDFEPVWASKHRLPWKGKTIAVVSRAGLVTMKRLAGRPQDLVDIDVLERRTSDDE